MSDSDSSVGSVAGIVPMEGCDLDGLPTGGMEPALVNRMRKVVITISTTLFGLTFLCGWGAKNCDSALFTARVAQLHEHDLGLYLCALVLISITRMIHSAALGYCRVSCGVLPPDQYVYKVMSPEQHPYVRLVADGVCGEFNRAQRAHHNYVEWMQDGMLFFLPAAFLSPKVAGIALCTLGAARVLSAPLYTAGPNGRFPGIMVSNLVQLTVQGLVYVAAVQWVTGSDF